MPTTGSSRSVVLAIFAFVVLVGGAAVFALTRGGTPPGQDEPPERPRAEREEPRGGAPAPLPEPDEVAGADPAAETAAEAPPAPAAAPEGVEPLEGDGIVGILVDARGEPVRRARVRIQRNLAELASAGGGRGLNRAIRIDPGRGIAGFGRDAGVTDRQGRFAIREPGEDGTYEVSFAHPDHADHTVDGVSWVAGSRVDLGAIRIPDGGTIFGFVRDEAGKPLANVRVWKTAEDSGNRGATSTSSFSIAVGGSGGRVFTIGGNQGEVTDGEGYFELTKVPPGTYTLRAKGESTAEAVREKLLVTEGGKTGPVELRPSRGLEISGVVVDERDQPVAGANVLAFRRGGGVSARTDAEGRFVLPGLSAGKVNVTVMAPFSGAFRGVQVREEIEAGTSGVRIVFRKGLSLAGRIVSSTTGENVSGASVTLIRQEGPTQTRRMTIAPDGGFRFRSLEPGEYRIEIAAPGYTATTEGPFALVEGRSIEDILVRLQPE
jgi:hypothetical protein